MSKKNSHQNRKLEHITPITGVKLRINKLQYLAEKYASDPYLDEQQVRAQDLTKEFYEELVAMALVDGETLNINVNGQTARGKTTVGMAITDYILWRLYKKEMTIINVYRDQHEFIKAANDGKLHDTVALIDEFSSLDSTGVNSTIEQKNLEHFSDVHAQRKIHRVACSPTEQLDKNADIFLEVYKKEASAKATRCMLYYRIFKQGIIDRQIIGHVNISVAKILERKWYKDYRERKFAKMELITQHGIFHQRELDYAELMQSVVQELRPLTKHTRIANNKGIILTYMKKHLARLKLPSTILAEDMLMREIEGRLNVWKSYYEEVRQYDKIRHALIGCFPTLVDFDKPTAQEIKSKQKLVNADKYKLFFKLIEQYESSEELIGEILNAISYQSRQLEEYIELKRRFDKEETR